MAAYAELESMFEAVIIPKNEDDICRRRGLT